VVVSRRSIRHRSETSVTTAGPRLLPCADVSSSRVEGAGPRWSFAARATALRLSPVMIARDLRDLGVSVPPVRLQRIMVGVEPAAPEVLTSLVEVLQLRDLALFEQQVVAAATAPWLAAGQRVPPRVVEILAAVRSLSVPQVLATAMRTRTRRP